MSLSVNTLILSSIDSCVVFLNQHFTYTNDGTLMCVLCNSVVRSEAVWNVHINAKAHKDNIHAAKQRKMSADIKHTSDKISSTSLKRPIEPMMRDPVPAKKIKGKVLCCVYFSCSTQAVFFSTALVLWQIFFTGPTLMLKVWAPALCRMFAKVPMVLKQIWLQMKHARPYSASHHTLFIVTQIGVLKSDTSCEAL